MSPGFLKQTLQMRLHYNLNFLGSLVPICCLGLQPVLEATYASLPGLPGWVSDVLLYLWPPPRAEGLGESLSPIVKSIIFIFFSRQSSHWFLSFLEVG